MDNDFDSTEPTEVVSAPPEVEQEPEPEPTPEPEPYKVEVNVNDDDYVLESVPDEASGYAVDDEILQKDGFDQDLLDDFSTAAHGSKITQRLHSDILKWWNRSGQAYRKTGYGDDFKENFTGFAIKNRMTANQVESLERWFNARLERDNRQIEQIKRFAKQAHGRSSSDYRSQAIARIRTRKAYTDKLDKNHAKAVQQMHELTQGRG